MGLLIFGVVFTAISALQAVSPRLMWRLSRWQYKNPEANEPSDLAMTVQRVVSVVFIAIGIYMIVRGANSL